MNDWPIAELVPHAGDMILIDRVLRFGDEDVETLATVRPGLFSQDDGSLPAWVGVELMAQSIAAYAGCQARQAGQPVELGFLLGTRNFQCDVDRFPAGAELHISATRTLQDDNGMGVFECRLEGPGLTAFARLNVFRPPQVARYLEEPQA
ncbi:MULTISPECIES: hotdog family protein [Pseudomonas]|uniref:ApeP family dehydratase n=1 Tax=Pseudomonas TaxID=286 RepID=UPI000DAA3A01|nr:MULTISPECIES: hotdog family protein [Pseudomonas]MDW3712582.1 hotdog family protein [Pseudomonas sp. 2023EL-01195]PZE14733.1 3-hydroxylacyl-ACP dehydratase [Pseudomonas sp. 57B-090624]